jgi:membrane protease YdiL (CAAX protease family)
VYNVAAAVVWGLYLAWRLVVSPSVLREWGFRRAGFVRAMGCGALFVILVVPCMAWYSVAAGHAVAGFTFWLVLLVYPVWGLAQQFALQALITRNLRGLVPRLPMRVLAASTLFAAAHYPNTVLMALVFGAGLVLTVVYETYRNLWALGLTHGILGAAAYYFVLGQDPGAAILGLLGRG